MQWEGKVLPPIFCSSLKTMAPDDQEMVNSFIEEMGFLIEGSDAARVANEILNLWKDPAGDRSTFKLVRHNIHRHRKWLDVVRCVFQLH